MPMISEGCEEPVPITRTTPIATAEKTTALITVTSQLRRIRPRSRPQRSSWMYWGTKRSTLRVSPSVAGTTSSWVQPKAKEYIPNSAVPPRRAKRIWTR